MKKLLLTPDTLFRINARRAASASSPSPFYALVRPIYPVRFDDSHLGQVFCLNLFQTSKQPRFPKSCMKTPTQSSSSQALDTITVAKRHMPFAWSPLTTRKLLLFGCVLSLPVAYQSPDSSARRLRFVGMWSGLEHFGSGSHQTSFGTVYHLSADGTGYRKSKFFGRNYANNDFWGGEY